MSKREFARCTQFLIENGWSKDHDDGEACEFDSYYKKDFIGVDISEEEIVFIGESGDFLSVPLNYFTLVGVLLEYRQIGFNYVSTRHLGLEEVEG